MSVDKDMVDFGGVFVGEMVRKTVTLRNSGALPTHFSLLLLTSASQVWHWEHKERVGLVKRDRTGFLYQM